MSDADTRVRIDKWLWAARFFKTRALAQAAVEGGKVHVDGDRVKPARAVRIGDRIQIRIGPYQWTITVLGLSDRRGPAPEAQKLYAETDESREARSRLAAEVRAARPANPLLKGRPTKKARRDFDRLSDTDD